MPQPQALVPPPNVWRTFGRLLRFARPFVPILLFAFLCSGVYAGARNARAYLMKPLLDDVLLAGGEGGAAGAGAGDLLPSPREWLGGGDAAADGETEASAPAPEADAPGGGAGPAAAGESGAASGEPSLAERVRERFGMILLAGLAIVLVLPLAHFGMIYLVEYTLGRVLVDIQQSLCNVLLALPLGFHQGMRRGETLSRITNDAGVAHRALNLLFADVVQSVIALAVGLTVLFTISWPLTLATLLVAPLIAGVIAFFGRRIRKTAQRRQESVGDVTHRLMQILSGIKVIKAFRAQSVEEAGFRRENLRLFRRGMKVVKNRALSRTLLEGLNNAMGVALLVAGAVLVLNGVWGLTPGSLAAFMTVTATTYRPMKVLTKGWTQLMEATPSAERFFELLDREPEEPDAPDAAELTAIREGIRFRDVHFSYGREPVLYDVSLEARAGEVVALVGPTGSGKTTLVDLLLRFYDPQGGAIEIDGVDLRKLRRGSLRDRTAVVTQDAFLFNGSIRDNIRYGRPGASDAEVEAAARAAHVAEFAERLPQGYDTDVGEGGGLLSGGQRQRVTIARALLRDPALLILDEATSALDAKSERSVQDALDALLPGRTVFVVAHRLSTVRRADRIVVLDGGRVVATGTHEELLARGGLYRELAALQGEE